MSVLTAEHLGRSVGALKLVDDISVDVRAGEVLAVVGPSGAGKSSFLRLLNRLDEPTAGTVLLEGVDYRQIPPRELRRRVGMVTQRAFLFPGTVSQNVGFGPRQRGEAISEARAEELLTRVGLSGYADRDVANLSGGEAQRVSLARALAKFAARAAAGRADVRAGRRGEVAGRRVDRGHHPRHRADLRDGDPRLRSSGAPRDLRDDAAGRPGGQDRAGRGDAACVTATGYKRLRRRSYSVWLPIQNQTTSSSSKRPRAR